MVQATQVLSVSAVLAWLVVLARLDENMPECRRPMQNVGGRRHFDPFSKEKSKT